MPSNFNNSARAPDKAPDKISDKRSDKPPDKPSDKPSDIEVFSCQNCGGTMEFNITHQKIVCTQCGTEIDIQPSGSVVEHDFTAAELEKADADWENTTHVMRCQNCGAEATVPKNVTSIRCAYCGSPAVLESKQLSGIKPEGILLFKIDKNLAADIFSKWIRSRFFAPGDLRTFFEQGRFLPVYMPYWTYDAQTSTNYTGMGGQTYFVTVGSGKDMRTEMRVRWFPVSGHIEKFFDDIIVYAGEAKPSKEITENFDTDALTPFETAFLSGYQAEKYSVSPEDGFERAKDKAQASLHMEAERQIRSRYDLASNISLRTSYSAVTFKHVLLPVWSSAYSYKNKLYHIIINGQSGGISGEYPISAVKIVVVTLAALLILMVLLFIGTSTGVIHTGSSLGSGSFYSLFSYNVIGIGGQYGFI